MSLLDLKAETPAANPRNVPVKPFLNLRGSLLASVLGLCLGLMLAMCVSVVLHHLEVDVYGWRMLSVSRSGVMYLVIAVAFILGWLAFVVRPWISGMRSKPKGWNPTLGGI